MLPYNLNVNLFCSILISGCFIAILLFKFIQAKSSGNTIKDFDFILIHIPGPKLGFNQDGCEIGVKTPTRKYFVGNFD